MASADQPGVYLTHEEYAALLAERDALRSAQSYTYIGKDGKPILARDLEDQRDALLAERDRLREALSGHQVWDKAEKVCDDEFVLWAPDGCVAVRLKITHTHEQLSPAGLEFLTCDLLDLLNARAALKGNQT